MTTISASYEGGTDGEDFTAANSNSGGDTPFTSRNIGSGGSMTFSATQGSPYSGVMAVAFNYNATFGDYVIYNFPAFVTTARITFRVWIYYPTGSGLQQIIIIRNTAPADIGYVQVNTSGNLVFTDMAGTDQITSPSTFPVDQWVMVQGAITVGTTTSNGILELAYWVTSDLVNPAWSGTTVSTANTGTAIVSVIRLGMSLASTATHTVWFDDLAATDTLSSGYIGPNPVSLGISTAWLSV